MRELLKLRLFFVHRDPLRLSADAILKGSLRFGLAMLNRANVKGIVEVLIFSTNTLTM